jgi:hypothetical protein
LHPVSVKAAIDKAEKIQKEVEEYKSWSDDIFQTVAVKRDVLLQYCFERKDADTSALQDSLKIQN